MGSGDREGKYAGVAATGGGDPGCFFAPRDSVKLAGERVGGNGKLAIHFLMGNVMQYFGRRYDTGLPVCVEMDGGKVGRVTPAPVGLGSADAWPWIGPGLLDIQVNGFGGCEFSSVQLTPERVAEIGQQLAAFGVTHYCPTVTTQHFDVLVHAMRTIATACDQSPIAARPIAGIHLEGPYLSVEDGPRGAHPREHCRRPDWDEFQRLQEAAAGRIRLLTMSVEFDEAPRFIEQVAASGVVVSIGHTAANSEQIRRAVDAGARLSTHLGNGAHGTIRRHPNYLWDQLAEDRLMASIIVDGHHLPPEVVKTFVRAKSPERCILVSDVSGFAGLPPGRYETSLCTLELLPSGRLVIAGQDQFLAGASLPLNVCVATAMQFAGVSLATAVRMASAHPADLLGLKLGGLEAGQPANLVQFFVREACGESPHQLEVLSTMAGGDVAFGKPWCP